MALKFIKNFNLIKHQQTTNKLIISSIQNRLSLPYKYFSSSTRKDQKSVTEDDAYDPNKPIEFLKTDAARWKAHVSRSGGIETAPWIQPYVIAVSLTVFMVYFCILREESDIDLEFGKTLYDRISGLEEKQLEIVLEYNQKNQLPTEDIEARLKEIRSSK